MSHELDDGFATLVARLNNLTEAEARRIDGLVDEAERERTSSRHMAGAGWLRLVDGSGCADTAEPVSATKGSGSVKVLVAGGTWAERTTFVKAASEIPDTPYLADILGFVLPHGRSVVDTETQTLLNRGSFSVKPDLTADLYSMPNPRYYHLAWEALRQDTIGAVVLVNADQMFNSDPLSDTVSSFSALAELKIPYVVAMDSVLGSGFLPPVDVREIFNLDPSVPVIECDAGLIASARQTVAKLVDHVIHRGGGSAHAIAAG